MNATHIFCCFLAFSHLAVSQALPIVLKFMLSRSQNCSWKLETEILPLLFLLLLTLVMIPWSSSTFTDMRKCHLTKKLLMIERQASSRQRPVSPQRRWMTAKEPPPGDCIWMWNVQSHSKKKKKKNNFFSPQLPRPCLHWTKGHWGINHPILSRLVDPSLNSYSTEKVCQAS